MRSLDYVETDGCSHYLSPPQFVHDHKVHYKRLAGGVEFAETIPKNPSGKLLRRFLREKAKEILAARAAPAKATPKL